MEEINEHLRDISEIRSMMERNSKFLSLSGLSGISAGICGLAGTAAGYFYLDENLIEVNGIRGVSADGFLNFFILVASLVLICAIGSAIFFSVRMAKKRSLPVWNKTARKTLMDLMIPLLAGGIFCAILAWHGHYLFISAVTLLFYGMALLNASKNTLPEIRLLAYSEIVLGLACAVWVGQGLLFWGLGFGLLHIVYGSVMYFKYER